MNNILNKLVRVCDLNNDFIIDLKYATVDNFTGQIVPGYKAQILYLSLEATQALITANNIFKNYNLRLKIFDGYRPQKAVNFFKDWRSIPEKIELKKRFHPSYTKEELFIHGFIASPSTHSSGSTVDLTLVDQHDTELDMGTEFDFFDQSSHTFAKHLAKHVRDNRQLLCTTLEENGFKNLETEWWHYTLKNEPYAKQYFDWDIE